MCTAVTYKTKDFYFGRTLDNEFSYGETITITPRNYEFKFKYVDNIANHYSIIGMAHVESDYPLYYDAVNEKGLGMAGLNFVGNAHYNDILDNAFNICQFEFIPWILCQCKNVDEAIKLIHGINITNTQFNNELPLARLHWIIADKDKCITIEATLGGMRIYDNPIGVLTNNPPFDIQMANLNNYINLSPKEPKTSFLRGYDLKQYSKGMGAIGLPGDLSSQSRFVRAAFTKMNSISKANEVESVSQFFHILGSVCQQRGCCELEDNEYEITIYTSCVNATKGIYYYKTYDNHQISAVDMNKEDLNSYKLINYNLVKIGHINMQN